jgi:hypothetical protein
MLHFREHVQNLAVFALRADPVHSAGSRPGWSAHLSSVKRGSVDTSTCVILTLS